MTIFRKLLNITLLVLILTVVMPYKKVEPELAPYEEDYMFYVQKYCTPNQYFSHPLQRGLYIKPLPSNIIAQCVTNGYTTMYITYNLKWWKIDGPDSRMVTMWHEFFHCYFGVPHSNDPNNFMYSYETHVSKEVMLRQAEELLKEKCSK